MEISGTLGHPVSRNTETRYGGFASVSGVFTAKNKNTHFGYFNDTTTSTSYAHDVNFNASKNWTGSTSAGSAHKHSFSSSAIIGVGDYTRPNSVSTLIVIKY